MYKKLAFSLAASALVGTTALAAAAPDCSDTSDIKIPGGLSVIVSPTQPPFPVAFVVAKINVPTHTVCYELKGNQIDGTTISPSQLCVNLAHKPAKDTKVTITFPNGYTLDATAQFGVATSEKMYALAKQICENPQANKPTTSFSLPQAKKGPVLAL